MEKYWRVPYKSAITQARQRLGAVRDETVVSSSGKTNGDKWNGWSIYRGTQSSRDRIKFNRETPLEDGSYLSWIYPPGKLRKKGFKPIQVRVIEYKIEHPEMKANFYEQF